MNWGTIIASGLSAIVVWFVTNVLLGPWADRRKALAAERRKYDLEPAVCGQCLCQVPQWFTKWMRGKPTEDGRLTAAQVCWQCMGLRDTSPHPYEQLSDFDSRVAKTRKRIAKAMDAQQKN